MGSSKTGRMSVSAHRYPTGTTLASVNICLFSLLIPPEQAGFAEKYAGTTTIRNFYLTVNPFFSINDTTNDLNCHLCPNKRMLSAVISSCGTMKSGGLIDCSQSPDIRWFKLSWFVMVS
jgi:hypothetical protein